MPVMRKAECSIHTEGGRLAEYQDKGFVEQSETKITRYLDITGVEGQRFWIEVGALQDFEWDAAVFNSLVLSVTADGVALPRDGSIKHGRPTYQYHGPLSSKLGADTIYNSNDTRLQSLGRIEVKLHRSMTVVTSRPWIGNAAITKSLASVHEKAIKGRNSVHGVQVHRPRIHSTQDLYVVNDTFLDSQDDPYITFVFLYRTKDTLIRLGLLPIAASPIEIIDDGVVPGPATLKQEIEALTAQLNKKKATLKRRYRDEDDSSSPIKRERKPSSRESTITARSLPGFVDLTKEV
ncbi:hypothetical protein EV426DRAFT_342629 [Tirmania nivea]|nr:hypothetical protein EV426DRAFT_342629 [Tirmania nivea]